MSMCFVRPETPDECSAVYEVNRAAFERDDEPRLVDALRLGGFTRVALVAEEDGHIVGHILFSALTIVTPHDTIDALALAPLAVVPSRQRRGIGTRLVWEGLRTCQNQGARIVVVLGHRDYYPRFGFSSHRAEGLRSPFSGPEFMALELVPGALEGVAGSVHYAPPFAMF